MIRRSVQSIRSEKEDHFTANNEIHERLLKILPDAKNTDAMPIIYIMRFLYYYTTRVLLEFYSRSLRHKWQQNALLCNNEQLVRII